MITTVQGMKYNFEIVLQNKASDCLFFIRVICKSTRRVSCINNLNVILSAFNIEIDDPKVEDSMWIVTGKEACNLEEAGKRLLSDSFFLNYLERQLDEDRMLGEWENKAG